MVLLEAMEKTNEAVDGENAGSASAMVPRPLAVTVANVPVKV
jgi:hypothetical protein